MTDLKSFNQAFYFSIFRNI